MEFKNSVSYAWQKEGDEAIPLLSTGRAHQGSTGLGSYMAIQLNLEAEH